MTTRLRPLTGATLQEAPIVCHSCIWWQSRTGRPGDKGKWIDKVEDDFGAWGSLYYEDDGRVVGSMQFGPAELFPRAYELPAGPPSDDAMLITCAYVVDRTSPWILQSLFLAAIGEAKNRGATALETFAFRYPDGETQYERFQVHKTIFPRDFLADLGFRTVRAAGSVDLVRLDLGGLIPVVEGKREKVLRTLRAAFLPAPVPERRVAG